MNPVKTENTNPVTDLVGGPPDRARGRDPEAIPHQDARQPLREHRVHQSKPEKQNEALLTLGLNTKGKQTEDEKIRLQSHKLEAWGMLAAGMAHELRNLLTVINSCAQFCLEEGISTRLRENLEMIRRNGQSANTIVKKLLNLTMTSDLEFGSIGLNEVVREVWDMIKVVAPDKKISFITKLDPQLPEIQGDREKLKRVFYNLFLNAKQAVSHQGKIIVETRLLIPQNLVEILIGDDGPGIAKEELGKIFNPFYSTKKEGIGLGLAICQSVIHRHKGSIAVDSGWSQGTRFSVRLPVHREIKE